MKLTKEQAAEKREALCKLILEVDRHKAQIDSLKKDLADDFVKNEKAYRDGIKTSAGTLYRKPSWNITAKQDVTIDA